MPELDRRLFRSVNRFADRTTWLHTPARVMAKDGIALFALLLLAGWWLGRSHGDVRRVAGAWWAGAAGLLALAANQPLAAAIDRARPYAVLTGVHVLVDRTTDFSFPSDHATVAGAVAAGLWFVDRRLGVTATACAAVLAASRVYVGAHFPGDVLAGLCFGAAVCVLVRRLLGRHVERVVGMLATTPLRPLLVAD